MESAETQLILPENLLRAINDFYRSKTKGKAKPGSKELTQLGKSVDIWLKFYPPQFKQKFMRSLLLPHPRRLRYRYSVRATPLMVNEMNAFVDKLLKQKGLKIFIGKDAYVLYEKYRIARAKAGEENDGCFIRYSRPFLFNKSNDNNYLTLTELIHQGNVVNMSFVSFYRKYKAALRSKGEFYKNIHKKSLSLLAKHGLIEKLNKYGSFTVIDSGMQGGLALPLRVVLEEEGYKGNVNLFFCFPWLSKPYKGKIQTHNIDTFVQLEHLSMREYAKAKRSDLE